MKSVLFITAAIIVGVCIMFVLGAGQHRDSAPPARTETSAIESSSPKPDSKPIIQETEATKNMPEKIVKSEEQWRKELTPEQYRILREKGTERAFTGQYWDTNTPGTYKCAGCDQILFSSDMKFNSHCGWPSFDRTAGETVIEEKQDVTHGMIRTEVLCSRCGGHLGHVFNDGPTETGLRYCINSAAIELDPQGPAKEAGDQNP